MILDPWNLFTSNFGHMPKPATAFVTLMDMVLYFVLSLNVGLARRKFQVAAPLVDGPIEFQQVFRVQQNTLEQLMQHVPILWIAAFAMDDVFAASLGSVWLFARILYARGYYLKPKRRAKGFLIGMVVNLILFVGALAGVVAAF